jgi:hypothetical protein
MYPKALRAATNSTIRRHRLSYGDAVESDRQKAAPPYLPTVTPAVERKASLRLVAFLSSSTSRVKTVVCPGMLRIGSLARGDKRRLALYGAAGST